MVAEAKGLEWRKEHGSAIVGVTRANQIVRKDKLSPSTVRRIKSFFARHEVDKEQGVLDQEKGLSISR